MRPSPIAALLAGALLLAGPARAADDVDLGTGLVDALNAVSGVHGGVRAAHAKGAMYDGTFTPTPEAGRLSSAPQFAAPLPVLVRLSDSSGQPAIPDGHPNANPHGMAVRFVTPDGAPNDIVAHAFDGFPTRTGEEFLEMLRAVIASPPGTASPTPIERFLGSHPAALRFVTAPKPSPRSFATEAYFAVNAFWLVAPGGRRQAVRYSWVPAAGQQVLEASAAAALPPRYLFTEMEQRLAAGPAEFALVAQLAAAGDPTDDATIAWPAERAKVVLGTLRLVRPNPDSDALQRTTNYDPNNLPAGIDGSDDPLLLARSLSYGVSIGRRQ